MNKIQKQKGCLVALGVVAIVLGIGLLVGGIILLVSGIKGVIDASSIGQILKIVFGIIMILLSVPVVWFGIKSTWVSSAVVATQGSIKEGNIAKEGGTINMVKCQNCGTEVIDGETVCRECGREIK